MKIEAKLVNELRQKTGAGMMDCKKALVESNGILDDDKKKVGKFFPGINTKIKPLKNTNVENSICLIAPVASTLTCRKLVEVLKNKKAEVILLPTITF